ncbi:MAG: hypothetical protein COV10_02075 [Candidatus Vogelbacteria bacterium CG10_big_fil_rev_8_21_14_0_10_51_16]|uniref:Glycosyltransferase RgtA/B/C/D-like domain-containing protein n=1 Tax=Candidatus Vogelbacteria bacterium CG10_big_fil_rev_8_21_14_0_10_51_16 TaxID=1975045 RepID=A0A2H0REJ2_9BACT|nr:MAG: hypothetical protein COV10_02075 [Candidatus Vogelbacteria bacterium CG10_big_fil_rev_8_21_14_0_10_51_16]
MSNMRKKLFNHKLALVLALLASFIVAFPQIYFRFEHGSDGVYQGIELLPDSPWSARAREAQDGHLNFGNIYQKDGKDQPYLFQPLGSIIVGTLGKIFSLDINNTFLLSRFVFTFAVFLLIYSFVFLFSKNKFAALCSAAILILAEATLSFSGLSRLLHGLSPDNFLRIGRPVNPAMVYFFLFAFLASFWLFYKRRNWRYGVLSVVILGLTFYNYFYTWTSLYAFGGLLAAMLIVRGSWREGARVGGVFAAALLLGVPYFINLYNITIFPTYLEVSARIGVLVSHAPSFMGFTMIAALIVFLLWFPREDKERYFFGLALLLTSFITHNQQILTGKVLQEDHYHWFFNKPMALIVVLVALLHLLASRGWHVYKKPLAFLIISASFGIGMFTQVVSYYDDQRDGGTIAIERQRYGPVMKWLNEHAEKESVIFANNEASHMVVIYTPLNVFYHRAVAFSTLSATNVRVFDMMFTFYRLRGVGEEEVRDVFYSERGFISGAIYGIYYRELLSSYEAIPDEKIEEVIAEYQKALATPTEEWLAQIWRQYEVEYLIWDKKSDPLWSLDKFEFLKKRAEFGDVVVYQFDK